ncbi:MAG TPA: MobH family relaxase [Phycisphaerae bacterium]|nr:MobH family relaxase [Phycisphaerae bacterium]
MKSLLGRFLNIPVSLPPAPPDEEIPRYPPFAKGLPAASVERILATQDELAASLRHTLALPERDYQTIVLPVIERYAAFTHLLPASEAHHHRGAGGLFRHGLEVAYWAALASEGVVFGAGTTPRERKEQEPRWRLAVCLAGLLHDIGKPVSDLCILDREGTSQWNPYLENLTDWAEKNGVDRYFLRWRDKRHQRHEQFSVLVAERVLTPECLSYLTQSGPDIMQAILEAIAGVEHGGVLPTLVLEADRKSVERDLKAHHIPSDVGLGVPVEKYLLDAMRRLVREGRWTANQRGGRVWRFADGLHVVWKTAAQEISELLAKDKVPGIPRDPDTIADILIERNLAVPRSTAEGRTYRYWRMAPAELDIALYMLRLASPELIYAGEPPIVVEGRVLDETESDTTLSGNEVQGPDKPASPSPSIAESRSEGEQQRVPSGPSSSDAPRRAVRSAAETTVQADVATAVRPRGPAEQHAVQPIPRTEQTAAVDEFIPAAAPLLPVVPALETDHPPTTPRASDGTSPAEKIRDDVRTWLTSHGLAGEILQAALDLYPTEHVPGIRAIDGRLWLPHPATAERIGREPKEFLRILDEAGWIETDLRSPLRKIREVDGMRGLMLLPEVGRSVIPLLGENVLGNATMVASSRPDQTKESAGSSGRKSAKKTPKPAPVSPEMAPAETARQVVDTGHERDPKPEGGSAEDLIRSIQQRGVIPYPVSTSEGWLSVPYGIIDWYVERHPGLTRAKLIIGLHRHPDCQLEGNTVLKVRASSP